MRNLLFIVLSVVGLGGLAVMALVGAFIVRAWFSTPFEVLGFGGAPQQPIAFPHTKHVQDAGIDCTFCHRNVTIGKPATVPAVEQCMFCHKIIGQPRGEESGLPEIVKLNELSGWDPSQFRFTDPQPVDWNRVHRLPDHVRFTHEAHLTYFTQDHLERGQVFPLVEVKGIEASQVCAICHGDVGSMEVVEQVRTLKMADCVDCHRQNNAPTDCVYCHY